MINIKINNNEFAVREDITIIEAARENGIDIPALGYDPRVSPPTNVEVAIVELVDGKGTQFTSATSTTVKDGMVVRTESPALRSFRQIYLQSLLRHHYGDCVAPCVQRCPAHIDIQKYLYHVGSGNFREALQVIKASNPLPSVCGRVCPHPCEAECRRNALDGAVNINAVKRFVADWDSYQLVPFKPEVAPNSGRKVAIIGAGPAGLTAAYFLRQHGHHVRIFEMQEAAGGMIRWGIPYYRLPEDTLNAEIQSILDLGVEIEYNKKLGRDFTIEDLKNDGYEAIFLGIGAQLSSSIRVEGEDLPGVLSGLDLLAQVARGKVPFLGDRVVVLGGGNTAMDAARTSVRLGVREVIILYRRTRNEMPADAIEIEEAIEEGVKMEFLAAPTAISPNDKRLNLTCIRMELGEPDASGRRRPVPVPGSEFTLDCSTIVAAIGQQVDGGSIAADSIISSWGTIKVDPETMSTSLEGVFAGGDCITGPDIAIEAIGAGQRAARAMHEYLTTGRVTPRKAEYSCSKGDWRSIPAEEFQNVHAAERNPIPTVAADVRKQDFAESTRTWDAPTAMREAARCLSCGCTERYDCNLREYATAYDVVFDQENPARPLPVDNDHPILVRDPGKCILCGLCLKVCREMEGTSALSLYETNGVLTIGPNDHRPLDKTSCVSCGHCVTVCPTGALTFKPVIPDVYRALNNPDMIVVAQIAPAVRAAFGQQFGMGGDQAMRVMAAGLKQIGFKYVFDTCWAADLTIMEEGTEFLSRLSQGGVLPQFTSCCPAWVNYCEKMAPDLLAHLSSCKSPQQMFGAVMKEYFAKQLNVKPELLYFVSIMPCNAKKYEAKRPEFSHSGIADVDAVLTTNEIIDIFGEKGIDARSIRPVDLDTPFGEVSGAGIIFGASGGVAEAALRLAAERITEQRLDNVEYRAVRGMEGIKEAILTIGDMTVRLAVVSGLQNAQVLIDRIRAGDAPYDLIEVMSCPGGCINGSGNPAPQLISDPADRIEVLYRLDEMSPIKKSQDNPSVQAIYSNWLGEPVSEKAHHVLHTSYGRRSMRVEESLQDMLQEQPVIDIGVCVSTGCYVRGSWRILEGLAAELRGRGLTDRFRVRARFCTGHCDSGPSVTLGEHQVIHVDPDDISGFIETHLLPALAAQGKEEAVG